jgi:hypothetical protein
METMTKPNAAARCEHIRDSGQRCGSPALRGAAFCYYHDRVHTPPAHPRKNPVAFIPNLECGDSMQIAITNVNRAVACGQLDTKQAYCIFYGMSLLRMAFDNRDPTCHNTPVTEMTPAMADALALASAPPEQAKSNSGIPVVERPEVAPAAISDTASLTPDEPKVPRKPTSRFHPSPLIDHPPNASLDDNQLAYCRFVLNYGFAHPEYDDCTRRMAAYIATGAAS